MTDNQQSKILEAAALAYAEGAVLAPDMLIAAQRASTELCKLVDFITELTPGLQREEAILLAAGILGGLPDLIRSNITLIEGIRENAKQVVERRNNVF